MLDPSIPIGGDVENPSAATNAIYRAAFQGASTKKGP